MICYLSFALLTYFIWMLVHELSHVGMAKARLNVIDWRIVPFPHFHEKDGKKRFVWARAHWRYLGTASDKEKAAISLAPRIPNLIAAGLLHLYWVLPSSLATFWAIFWIGGLVDLAYGSVGWHEHSDLRRAADKLQISPWILRVAGWTVALATGLPILISEIF